MARLIDAVTAANAGTGATNPTLNIAHGGQGGAYAHIGVIGADGKNYEEWINNHAYIRKNIIAVVLSYPKFFDFMPNGDKLKEIYKAMIEVHPVSIDGLASGLTVSTDEHPIGRAGEVQEEITGVTRAKSNPSFTLKEKAGKAFQKFLDLVIRYGYMDPDTNKPLVMKYLTAADLEDVGGIYTPDFYTGTVLFIEPDTTQRVVVDSWLCTNMFFKSNGDRTGKMAIQGAGETLDLTIESSAITMCNEAVQNLAKVILKSLTVIEVIPDTGMVTPVSEIDPAILAAATGYNQK